MAYYVLDDNKNLVQSFDREGFLAILQQAIADQSLENIDEDSAVASKLRSNINGTAHYIEFVTAAQYAELETQGALVLGTYYFITDDTTEEDLETAISGLITTTDGLTETVGNLVPRVGAVETGKLDKSTYNADFVVGGMGSGTGWTSYDTSVGLNVESGLYLCLVHGGNILQTSTRAVVMLFVGSDVLFNNRSASFWLDVSQTSTPDLKNCYVITRRQSGNKCLKVVIAETGADTNCFLSLHKIGGTV